MIARAIKPRVGLVGASGMVGNYMTHGFINHGGYDVSLLTRKGGNQASLAPFAAKGAKIVEADFDSESDLTSSLKGLDIVVSTVGAVALGSQPQIIKAAKAAGVRRFVPSEFGVDTGRPGVREYFPVLGAKFATRDALEASGLEYSYFITGCFLETTFTPAFYFDVPNGKATIKGKPDTPFVVTSLKDIARWTAAALLAPESKNSTIYLKGEELSFSHAVKVIEEATGKKLDVTHVSAADLDAQIAAAPNLGAAFIDLLVKAIAEGWGSFPDKWSGQDAPSATLATHAKSTTWQWNA